MQHHKSAAYISCLDDAISERAQQGNSTLNDLIASAKGASPKLVAKRVEALELKVVSSSGSPTRERQWTPELHPIGFEYYFTEDTAIRLLDRLEQEVPLERLLTLGTPTIAAAAGLRDLPTTLVDSNRLLDARFEHWPRSVERVYASLNGNAHLTGSYSAVVLDPPWYVGDMSAWLIQATSVLCAQGLIAFPLFGEFTRPTAKDERAAVLELASALGHVEVLERELNYETPLFEREAFACSGLFPEDVVNWRTALT